MGPDFVDGFGKVVGFGVRKRRKEGGDGSVMEKGEMRKVSPFEGFDVEKRRKEARNGDFGVGKQRKEAGNGDFGVRKRRKECVDGRMEEETGDVIKVEALGMLGFRNWRKECWNWSSGVGESFEKGKRSPVKVEALEGSGQNLRRKECGNWSPGELGAGVDESFEKEMENMIRVAPSRDWSRNLRRKECGNWSPGESGTGVDESMEKEGCSLKVVTLESSDVDRWTIEQENQSLSGSDFDVDEKIEEEEEEEEEGSSSSKIAALDGSDLYSWRLAVKEWGNRSLAESDPDIYEIMEKEKQRQVVGIELVASENYVCKAVLEALGSHLTNKYSEGAPGARYYCGNSYIDQIERLCQNRALEAFGLDPECWGVNVQPYSCTSANFAVFTGLLLPKDRIMGLDSPSGGHVSHGLIMPSGKKVSGTSIFFENLSYKVNPQTGLIDYDKLEEKAVDYRPKILICGGSSYPREWDYARFRKIANKCGAVLMCDMAHISGLVAAKECSSPFNYCDIVTSTTHKSLRGPRGGIIFFRKGKNLLKQGCFDKANGSDQYDFEEQINFAVFPSLQGGPHNNHIAALAIALKQVATPEYKAYIQQVKRNAQALATALCRRNCRLVTGGTDNHLILWDLRNFGLTGKNFEKVCETCHITVNKTPIFGDNGTISPAGVRIGTPAMTTRGCLEEDFELIAEFLLKAVHITSIVQREHGKLPKKFLGGLHRNGDIVELRSRVEAFSSRFAMPGFDV